MPAHARIVPVGDQQAAIRGHADIRRPEPGVIGSHHVFAVNGVAGSLRPQVIATNVTRTRIGVQELAAVFFRQQLALVDAHARGRAKVRSQDLGHDAGFFFMPVSLARPARMVAVVGAGQHLTDARLLIAVIVVVRDEDRTEAIDTGLVFVAEVVGDQLKIFAVLIAAPDRAGPAVGLVAGPGLAVLVDQAGDPLIADTEIEPAVGTDRDAMHAVIVVDASEAREKFSGGPVRLTVAVLVLEHENVGRLAHEYGVAGVRWMLQDSDSQRRQDFRRLVENGRLVGFAGALAVFEDEDAIAFFSLQRTFVKLVAVVDRLANPHPAERIHVHAGGIGKERLRSPELDLQSRRNLEHRQRFFGSELGVSSRYGQQGQEGGTEQLTIHGKRSLRRGWREN
jgi:hypothetical protein